MNDELSAVRLMQARGPEDLSPIEKACRQELPAKRGTWFQGCEQPIRIRAWGEKMAILAFCRATFDMNKAAGFRLNAAMRRVAEEWLLNNPVPVICTERYK
uniref:Uncharacterized protein n=1 Tax=Trichuris muris TaxID=70415 RepID=A0A5S6QF23_TRIMR